MDNKSLEDPGAGADVKEGVFTLDGERLYNLVNIRGKVV
jgi:hypothetical protein